MGSVLTNKYAEGYPGRRYYGGCEIVDIAESLAIARAKELFGAEHANVQPHSGAQANMAVFFTLLKPGDTVLGPNLSHGGHLTAGSPVNYSGKFYTIVAYGVRRDTELIDLDQVRDLARRHRPKLIIAGGSAFPRAIDFRPFGEIAGEVGAALMADIAHPAGLVAAGLHPSPVGVADFVTTTTHKTLRGPARPSCPSGAPTSSRSSVTPRRWRRRCSRAATVWSPGAPTRTSCSWTSRPRGSPGRTRRRRSIGRGSP